jgi:hypothetical protein
MLVVLLIVVLFMRVRYSCVFVNIKAGMFLVLRNSKQESAYFEASQGLNCEYQEHYSYSRL